MKNKYFVKLKKYGWKIAFGIILGLSAGFIWYTSDYYRADQSALKILENQDVYEYKNYVELKADSDIGLIFYPGAKVESYAYLGLLDSIRDEGINVFLIKMPFNLAVFNINAADSILKEYPDIQEWYIGGHSLGGAMASQYLEKNANSFDGLIQLAAYPLNQSEKNVLVLYGSNDQILDLTKVDKLTSTKIEGGNHAYFGNYGEQDGDGQATISRTQQQDFVVNAILDFVR